MHFYLLLLTQMHIIDWHTCYAKMFLMHLMIKAFLEHTVKNENSAYLKVGLFLWRGVNGC